VHINIDQKPAKAEALPRISVLCLISWPTDSISPTVSQCQMRLANVQSWIRYITSQDICWELSGAPEVRSYASKCCGITVNPWTGVLYSDTATQYGINWLYCQMGSTNMQHLICCDKTHHRSREFHGKSGIGRIMNFFILLISKCVHGLRFLVYLILTTDKWFEALWCIVLNSRLMPSMVRYASQECVM